MANHGFDFRGLLHERISGGLRASWGELKLIEDSTFVIRLDEKFSWLCTILVVCVVV